QAGGGWRAPSLASSKPDEPECTPMRLFRILNDRLKGTRNHDRVAVWLWLRAVVRDRQATADTVVRPIRGDRSIHDAKHLESPRPEIRTPPNDVVVLHVLWHLRFCSGDDFRFL